MENKKEPLMSVEEFYKSETKQGYCFIDMFDFAYLYSDYAIEWHLNNAKEFVADGVNCKQSWFGPTTEIDKQSIHTAIDNYIEINLNKEL